MINKNSKISKEKLIEAAKPKCRTLNCVCAAVLLVAVILYFCEFFRVSIDGAIENGISGFKMSFLLLGDTLKDKNNILYLVNKNYAGTVKFASVASLLCLISLLALLSAFIYRAFSCKPVLSKAVILLSSVSFVLLIMQILGCSFLTSTVTQYYYSNCVTCLAQSFSYIPIIFFIVLAVFYPIAAYIIYCTHGVAFRFMLKQTHNIKQ